MKSRFIENGGYIYNECGHWYKTLVFWGEILILTDPDEKERDGDYFESVGNRQ